MTRTFEARPAIREKTPVLVGLVGPSGVGKTYSALRLAAGFQRVTGGDTYVIDSEGKRALHYAEAFRFVHVPFAPPFSPLDYIDVIDFAVKSGATTVVVDSMSHEHEGQGGVLEMHAAELERMGGGDNKKMLAWIKPKQERRRLINAILQHTCNFIFCFRAKEKLKIERGKEPAPLGFMPIAGEEFLYEMTACALLLPGANGVPTWKPAEVGEQQMVKLPGQFRDAFAKGQLSEDIGEALARWAAGAPPRRSAADLIASYVACADADAFRALEEERGRAWKLLPPDDDKKRLAVLAKETEARIAKALDAAPADTTSQPSPEATGSDPA